MTTRSRFFILFTCATLLCQFGCVRQGTYQKKVEETSFLTRELDDLRKSNSELAGENEGLRSERVQLQARVAELEEGKKTLEQMLTEKSEPSFGVIAALEREKARLSEDLARLLSAREGKVRDVSRIYENLLEAMKDEIAAGRVTVSELRGKLTIAIRDEALFNAGRREINPAGISLLLKITDRLKGAAENELCIALPFEIPEHTPAADAAKWSPAGLLAERAMAIARLFRQQGIEPENLLAAVQGEFAPPRGEGRPAAPGKASRVEITVSAKGPGSYNP